jgi:NTE family protein
MPNTPSWGLALSGGGACGLANAGVLAELEQAGLRPDCIAGSSMGAIVGGLYASGESMEDCMQLCTKLRMRTIAKWSERIFRRGLHGGALRQRLEDHLSPVLGNRCVGDCVLPFVCVAGRVKNPIQWHTIVKTGFTEHVMENVEPYIFPPETRLIDAMLASSAIPVIFSPVEIGGETYIDLCHFGAIPARSLRSAHHPDIIVATDTTPEYALTPYLPRPWRVFLETGYAELRKSKESCDLVITPDLPAPPFRFDRAMDFVEAGKSATRQAIPALQELLQSAL